MLLSKSANEAAETRRGDRAGLAGHRAGETLAFEDGGEIGFAAWKETGEEFHDFAPCNNNGHTGQPSRNGVGRLVG